MVALNNLYILIDKSIFQECLKNSDNIFYCFYVESKKLLIAPVSATYFSSIHKSQSAFFKTKNAQGTKAFQIASIIVDNPSVDESNRVLKYNADNITNILTIYL